MFRRLLDRLRVKPLAPEQLSGLVYGQHHVYTQSFFRERHGQYHSVELDRLPHYEFLRDGPDPSDAGSSYAAYLACSWDYYLGKDENTWERRRAKAQEYLALFREIEGRRHLGVKAIHTPIELCHRPDGRVVLVSGNHRAAIALALGLELRARFLSPEKWLTHAVTWGDEYYGTGRLGMPYQSISHRNKLLVRGRRPDLLDRMNAMEADDIRDRTVLDLGCNIGMNCYLAAERGARRAVGVEHSMHVVSAAARINSYFAAPCDFLMYDLNQPLTDIGSFDTVFCFSLVRHLDAVGPLAQTLRHCTRRVLYFEGHAGTSQQDYAELLSRDSFSSIDLIGYGRDAVDASTSTRPWFRCQV